MKELIKKWIGPKNMSRFRLIKRAFRGRSKTQNLQSVFSGIYSCQGWGGKAGSLYSGEGSSLERIVGPYVECIQSLLSKLPEDMRHVVDLGCGDFEVGRRYAGLCTSYTGVDIVPDIITLNQQRYGNNQLFFRHCDITRDPLPAGRICLIRQVLQHLSNKNIETVLKKISGFDLVVVTEHYPRPEYLVRKNIDKEDGAEVRAVYGSGVYLDAPPFRLQGRCLNKLLEVEGSDLGTDVHPGLIIAYSFRP